MQNQTSSAPQTAVASDAPLNLCIKSKCSSSDLQTWVSLQQTYAMTIMSECLGSLLGELLGGMLSGPAAVLQTLTTLNGAPKCFVGCLFGDIPSVITEANLAKFCTPLIASMSATAKPTATAQVDPTSACIMSKCGTSDQLSLQSLMTGNFSMNLISACMYETTLVGKGPVSVAASSTTTTATTTASKTSGGFDLIPKLSFLPMRLLFLFLFLWV
ncbi:hypothetical protein BDR26DRAFT_865010 [Obelidium mucronatum]|nr:hypothetical protein BDR26DRAFT_865010 [Obelidium mucronatum]